MRTNLALMIVLATLLLAGCGGGGGGEDDRTDGRLADRVLRLGEDLQTGIDVLPRESPGDLSAVLNRTATADTPDSDLVALAVHPDGELLGSFRIERSDGVISFWLFYDVHDERRSVEQVVTLQLDVTPWQVVAGQSTDTQSAIRFENTFSADVAGTAFVREIEGGDDGPLTAVVYILEVQPLQLAAERDFELPEARHIPEDFPASFLVLEGMVPITVLWFSDATGDNYQLVLLTRVSAFDVASEYRERLAAENWELVDDRAVGFATELDFQTEGGGTQGSVSADAFADDDSYTAVIVDLRTSSRSSAN